MKLFSDRTGTSFLLVSALVLAPLAACSDDDGDGGSSPTDGGDDNRPPTASFTATPPSTPAGDNHQTVVTLDGSESSDPDGDPLTFDWTVPSGRFVNGTSASSEVAEVTFPGLAPYTVTLEVSDGRGGSDSDSFTVSVGG